MAKRALLIGCNYLATPQATLYGCINDVVNMRNMLIDAYGYQSSNIVMLRDDDKYRLPTRANILAYIAYFINTASSSDTVWIHYSGHGTRLRDINGDESDGADEAIVPCDYMKAGMIVDDELFNLIRPAKCTLILCFDSCHSGSVCDLQYSINYNNGGLSKVVNSSKFISTNNIIMFSGCRDVQTSADSYDSLAKQGVGAFTNALIETLRANSHNVDLLKLFAGLCAYLKMYGFTQIPVLSSTVPNPVYQFSRSASIAPTTAIKNSTGVTGATKDLLSNMVGRVNSSVSLRGRMQRLISK
jgi:hypothetical protein